MHKRTITWINTPQGISVGNIVIRGSGWKPLSMVDVYGSITFTIWLCGCNLRCPFCHNWLLAVNDPTTCRFLDVSRLLDEIEASKKYIDYVHTTGGEPLVQYRELEKLYGMLKYNIGVSISLNTNMTLYKPLKNLVDNELIDHVATDLKIPHQLLYGYEPLISEKLWNLFLKSLEYISQFNVKLELRIPVARNIDPSYYLKYGSEALRKLSNHRDYYIIVQPLLGPPITNPRNPEWCKRYCNPSRRELKRVADIFHRISAQQVIIKETVEL